MNDLLFFVISVTVVGLSYYLGFKNGNDQKIKEEIRQFLHEVTVSKMAHDVFMQRAKNETRLFLRALGAEDIDVKQIKTPKLPKPEDFDKINR
jgi:hypothetical protein